MRSPSGSSAFHRIYQWLLLRTQPGSAMGEPYLSPPDDVGASASRRGPQETETGAFLLRIGKLSVAGTIGGLAECMAAYPLDTVKTRMQTSEAASSGGAFRCFSTAIREDGALALYRGMSSRVVASMLAASVLFGANGTLKEVFGADSSQPLSGRFMLAAMGTGVLEAIAYCPLELVKTRMQVLRGSPAGVTVWTTGAQIYRHHGIFKGSYKGFSSMLLKEGLGNTVYFGSYELCKQALGGRSTGGAVGSGGGGAPGDERQQQHQEQAGIGPIVAAGGCAGVLYTVATHPIDTVKSLVQTDSIKAPRYRGFLDGWRQALAQGRRRHGVGRGDGAGAVGGVKAFLGLYRGLSPAIARAFLGNSALFVTYESVLDVLGR
ncbi:conserved unknown protein [Ectocarpus siliculosus]|uniref:Uncharacterized protein n=1 Tax=Ectocarpus siliculosus TaxID=2880 RepID=D8LLY5_ECTSI|nr:conserved unknown protein [Ectocarpus siliculosus]|eukprot:CBN77199.1 conserved unknown protein [Ectocarpus siliculosus]